MLGGAVGSLVGYNEATTPPPEIEELVKGRGHLPISLFPAPTSHTRINRDKQLPAWPLNCHSSLHPNRPSATPEEQKGDLQDVGDDISQRTLWEFSPGLMEIPFQPKERPYVWGSG